MGCGSGKLAPDSPIIGKKKDLVKQVETGFGNGVTPYSKPDNSRPKIPKYKVKVDPRVTAKYVIKALIGTGSFSRVVRVEHRTTKQPYAIKMVEKRKEGKEVCETELSILRRVRHSHIIQLIEVFDSKDRIYMVMELATGGELFDRIVSKGNFNERDATHVLRMVLDAVKYLHNLGITHRDIKPENLLYYHPGKNSKIMITDFGLASCRKGGDDVMMNTTCGTPEYIAPEILCRKSYTNAVDLWAIGVVTYILLSGRMPFDDENRTRLYRKILRAKYAYTGEPWKDVSAAAKDFIDKLLRTNPAERMTCAQALKHPWIVTNAGQSSLKNLHRSISQNWLKRTSTRSRSSKSTHSTQSNKSTRSRLSGRSAKRRIPAQELDGLESKTSLRDPQEVAREGKENKYKL
ncbi:serine/threonine-protein kinase H1-like [Anneissia japonica]|uniref:serine/threonine-protein kinase H1-like n=1 Tax=Anneissia japonica TaxID=1529436 RepID=UPI0014255E86|nr:serine/threonine-protein kinase H1-like [Anneissia japonica]